MLNQILNIALTVLFSVLSFGLFVASIIYIYRTVSKDKNSIYLPKI